MPRYQWTFECRRGACTISHAGDSSMNIGLRIVNVKRCLAHEHRKKQGRAPLRSQIAIASLTGTH